MKKYMLVVLTALLLAGCSNAAVDGTPNGESQNTENKTAQIEVAPGDIVCYMEMEGVVEEKVFEVDDDGFLLSTTSYMTIPYSLYGDITDKEKNNLFEDVKKQFEYKGVTVTNESSQDNFVIKIVFDYTEADFKELEEAGHILVAENADMETDIYTISFEEALSYMLTEGYTCVVK